MKDCDEWRDKLIEAAAEANDELMDKYLEGGELTEAEIVKGIRIRTLANEIVPVPSVAQPSRTKVCRRYWTRWWITCRLPPR